MSDLNINVDRDACVACDLCNETAPNTFEIDDEAKVRVKDPKGDPRDTIISAAESCPVNAIIVLDAATGEKLVPKD
jgi:ferredoxin